MLHELLNEQDQTNPQITISGFGTLDLNTAKAGAIKRIEKALVKLKHNPDARDWENAHHILYGSGVVEEMLTSIYKNHPK